MTAAVVAALVLGFILADPHKHRCRGCGNTWRHLGIVAGGTSEDRRSVVAHTCKKCGARRWLRD